jgi:hypothetical protein
MERNISFNLVNGQAVSFARDHAGDLTPKWLSPGLIRWAGPFTSL